MEKKNFIFEKKDGIYYLLIDQIKDDDMSFSTKLEGVNILIDCHNYGKLSNCETLYLLDEVVSKRDIHITNRDQEDQLFADLSALIFIRRVRKDLIVFSEVEKSGEPIPVLVVCECGKHAKIIGQSFVTPEFYDKASLVMSIEKLLENDLIDIIEKVKLLEKLYDTNLPAQDYSAIAEFN